MSLLPIRIPTLFRLAFLGAGSFEAANFAQIIHFKTAYTWFGLLLTLAGVWALLEAVARLHPGGVHGFPWFVWPIVALAVSVDFFGDLFRWYFTYPWYDQLAHFVGGASATIVFIQVVRVIAEARGVRLPDPVVWLLAFGFTNTGAVLYETEEYLEDLLTHSARLGDGYDTANDIMLSLIAATLVVSGAWALRAWKRHAAMTTVVTSASRAA